MTACSVDGCQEAGRLRKGWCPTHYFRWYRTGDLGSADIARKHPGAVCKVDACTDPVRAGSTHGARGYCVTHYTRVRRHGAADVVLTPTPVRGEANVMWAGEAIAYSGMHQRVTRARGRAFTMTCPCGAPADEWAYDHADPNPKTSDQGPFSLDVERYVAMCRSCHRTLDARRER